MEWFDIDNNNLQQQQQQQQQMMHMDGQFQGGFGGGGGGGDGGGGFLSMKVFTDEQMETLRKQISVYATICDQLVEMHKSFSAKQALADAGMRYGNPYFDPTVGSGGQKIPARQRWTPTPVQREMLEQIYELSQGTPSKQRIKEITAELEQHGKITETNVYNWFQNRRARTKRKQSLQNPNNSESELEPEIDPADGKVTKPEISQFMDNNSVATKAENLFLGSPDHYGIDQILGKLDFLETLSPLPQVEQFDALGCGPNVS